MIGIGPLLISSNFIAINLITVPRALAAMMTPKTIIILVVAVLMQFGEVALVTGQV
jgi:hypothetical protein